MATRTNFSFRSDDNLGEINKYASGLRGCRVVDGCHFPSHSLQDTSAFLALKVDEMFLSRMLSFVYPRFIEQEEETSFTMFQIQPVRSGNMSPISYVPGFACSPIITLTVASDLRVYLGLKDKAHKATWEGIVVSVCIIRLIGAHVVSLSSQKVIDESNAECMNFSALSESISVTRCSTEVEKVIDRV